MKLMRFNIFMNAFWHLITAFLLPVLVLTAVYINFGMYPFGKESILVLDMNAQYIDYFAALRNIFSRDTSIFYSWSRNLGGEMMGLTSYYIASPFSLLVFLFPKKNITEAVLFISILKIACSGLALALYLQISKKTSKFSIILFSLLYSLSAYMIVQIMNLMWIDALALLPLIILGVENIINQNKFKLFLITLTIMFISNFYVAYMVGVFSFIYFIYYFFCTYTIKDLTLLLKKFGIYIGTALIAGGCCLFLIIPTYFSMKMGKFDFDQTDYLPTAMNQFFDIITKMLPGSYDTVENEGLPFIYSGTICLLLLPAYFMTNMIDIKKRVLSAFLLGILFISFNVHTLFVAWHLFNMPNWLPHRFSFLFSFMVIVLSSEAFENIKNVGNNSLIKIYSVLIILVFIIEKLGYKFITTESVIWFALIFLTVYIVFLCINKSIKRKTLFSMLLILVVCIELFFNSTFLMVGLYNDVGYSTRSSYTDFIEETQPLVDAIKEQDNSLYRMEKNFKRSTNDALSLGMAGISHSSSTLNMDILNFLRDLGFASSGHWACYSGSTLVTDSILGIKYILSRDKINHDYYIKRDFIKSDINVYENPYALPFGFMVDKNFEKTHLYGTNPFYIQNVLLSNLLGKPYTEFFKSLEIQNETLTNLKTSESAKPAHTQYTPANSGKDAKIKFILEAPESACIYGYFPTNYKNKVDAVLNGKFLYTYYDNYNFTIISMGSYKDKQQIPLELKLLEDELNIKDKMFYYLDMDLFKDAIKELNENSLKISEHTETFIKGTISVNDRTLMYTSIPFENGWEITIDGKKVKPVKVLDALLAIFIPEGAHEITFNFVPEGFLPGCIISIISLLVLIALLIVDKIHFNKIVLFVKSLKHDK